MMSIKLISIFLVFVLNFQLCMASVTLPVEKTEIQKGAVKQTDLIENEISKPANPSAEGEIEKSTVVPLPETNSQPKRYVKQNLREPKWEEFAAANQIDPKLSSEGGIVLEQAGAFLVICTIIGFPIGLGMIMHANKRKEANYWYGRKQNFINAVNYCNQFINKDDVYACYQDVRNNEMLKNTRNNSGQVRKYY